MPSLELILEDLADNQASVHESFRLFLTSMPATYFPVSILQNGIKLTIEPPRGLRANLKRSLNDITDEYLERCSKRDTFHKLVLGTCMFHAII
jgi:dynein heavy chain